MIASAIGLESPGVTSTSQLREKIGLNSRLEISGLTPLIRHGIYNRLKFYSRRFRRSTPRSAMRSMIRSFIGNAPIEIQAFIAQVVGHDHNHIWFVG